MDKASIMQDEIDSLNTAVISLAYYLYRQAGCPLGDNTSGLVAWIDVQRDIWKNTLEPDEEDAN